MRENQNPIQDSIENICKILFKKSYKTINVFRLIIMSKNGGIIIIIINISHLKETMAVETKVTEPKGYCCELCRLVIDGSLIISSFLPRRKRRFPFVTTVMMENDLAHQCQNTMPQMR